MTEYSINEAYSWAFPDLNTGECPSSKDILENEVRVIKKDLLELKNEYENGICFVNKLITEIQEYGKIVDNEISELVLRVIRKVSEHIVKKEVSLDSSVINKSIEELISLLPKSDGLITVYLSTEDFARIKHLDNKNIIAKENCEISSGDIIIRSSTSEIKSILDERIKVLLETKYE